MDLIAVIGSLDLVNKADALIRGIWFTARGRGSHCTTFAVPLGMAPVDLERILFRRGVAVFGRGLSPVGHDWGGGIKTRVAYFHHSAKQTGWVEYVLSAAGAVILKPSDLASVTTGAARGDLPPAWADKAGGAGPGPGRPNIQETPRSSGGRVKRALRDLW